MSLNAITLVGHAGRDPEIRFFESGTVVAHFTLAVNKPGRDEPPDWFNIEIWGKQAQVAADYVRKGSLVGIVGRMTSEQWTDRNTGEVRSKPLVKAERLALLGSKNVTAQADGATSGGSPTGGQGASSTASQPGAPAQGAGRPASATGWGAPAGAGTPGATPAPTWTSSGPISAEEVPF
jgi:single-strand DNA-binding protein